MSATPKAQAMPKRLMLLITFYTLLAIAVLWRTAMTGAIDLFTLGVLPVLVGLLIRAPWSSLVLKICLGLQTLGFSAFGITAFLAYRITPQDVKVVIAGQNIPMLPLVLSILVLLSLQFWIAFSGKTCGYLNHK